VPAWTPLTASLACCACALRPAVSPVDCTRDAVTAPRLAAARRARSEVAALRARCSSAVRRGHLPCSRAASLARSDCDQVAESAAVERTPLQAAGVVARVTHRPRDALRQSRPIQLERGQHRARLASEPRSCSVVEVSERRRSRGGDAPTTSADRRAGSAAPAPSRGAGRVELAPAARHSRSPRARRSTSYSDRASGARARPVLASPASTAGATYASSTRSREHPSTCRRQQRAGRRPPSSCPPATAGSTACAARAPRHRAGVSPTPPAAHRRRTPSAREHASTGPEL
jgi:hypothetical protein